MSTTFRLKAVDHTDHAAGDDTGRARSRRLAIAEAVHAFVEATQALPVDRLDDIASLAAEAADAQAASIYIADYSQRHLRPLPGSAEASSVPIDDSTLGAVFRSGSAYFGESRIALPLVEERDRIGVLEFRYEHGATASVDLAEAVGAALVLALVSKRRYTDITLRTRRARPLTTAAEMQWDLLPPLACRASAASIAGILEPAYSTGGDSFDFAVNDDLLEFIVIDAVGHGMPAVLKSIAAITTYRNVRRESGGLTAIYNEIGRVMIEQFGECFYVTGLIGSLRMSSGELTWINAGHPQPLLIRGGSAEHALWCAPSLPMGLGGTVRDMQSMVLQPGDRVLVYTDGAVDRRGSETPAPHLEALTDQVVAATVDGTGVEETLRQLIRSVLESCDDNLDDDASLVLLEQTLLPRSGHP
jgi:serine phosphatase RsbU (regulator of sigma subunit)